MIVYALTEHCHANFCIFMLLFSTVMRWQKLLIDNICVDS
jgi:hypothetical protein